MNQLDEAKSFARLLFEPRENLSIPEWAEKNLTLSARVTNIPGAYSTNLTPMSDNPSPWLLARARNVGGFEEAISELRKFQQTAIACL